MYKEGLDNGHVTVKISQILREKLLDMKNTLYYFGASEEFEYVNNFCENFKLFFSLQSQMEIVLDTSLKDFVSKNPLEDLVMREENIEVDFEGFVRVRTKRKTLKRSLRRTSSVVSTNSEEDECKVILTCNKIVMCNSQEESLHLSEELSVDYNEKSKKITIETALEEWYLFQIFCFRKET